MTGDLARPAVAMPENHTECLEVLMGLGRATMTLMDEVGALHGNRGGVWIDQLEQKLIAQVRSSNTQNDQAADIGVALVRSFATRLRRRLRAH